MKAEVLSHASILWQTSSAFSGPSVWRENDGISPALKFLFYNFLMEWTAEIFPLSIQIIRGKRRKRLLRWNCNDRGKYHPSPWLLYFNDRLSISKLKVFILLLKNSCNSENIPISIIKSKSKSIRTFASSSHHILLIHVIFFLTFST